MELLKVEETDETPAVSLDPTTGVFEFVGKSLPEGVTQFYNPIIEWLEEYESAPNATTKAIFKMDYFNTASSKLILDILMKLEEIHEEHEGVSVEWHFREDDEDMEEAGEEYSEIVEIPFEQISF